MSDDLSRRAVALGLGSSLLLGGEASAQAQQTYSRDEILAAAQRFFGAGAEGLGGADGTVCGGKLATASLMTSP
jgi:hypothetical protein